MIKYNEKGNYLTFEKSDLKEDGKLIEVNSKGKIIAIYPGQPPIEQEKQDNDFETFNQPL